MKRSAYVLDSQALLNFRNTLKEFCSKAHDVQYSVNTEIRRILDRIQQQERYWHRNVNDAHAAYDECMHRYNEDGYRYSSCREEAFDLQHAEDQLKKVLYWKARVEQSIGEYRHHSKHLQYLLTTRTERAQVFLDRKIQELERYAALIPTVSDEPFWGSIEGRGKKPVSLETAGIQETFLYEQQVSNTVQVLEGFADLQHATWKNIEHRRDRLKTLNRVEQQIAKAVGRPAVDIDVEPKEQGNYGKYDSATRRITLGQWLVESNDIREILDTLVHESRHAYQHHAVENPGFHPDSTEVGEWKRNFDRYLKLQVVGEKRYRNQPIQADAWQFAADTLNAMSRDSGYERIY